MLSKRYESTEANRRTWLHVPSVTHLFTSREYRKYAVFCIFLYMIWHTNMQFCILICFHVSLQKFECHHFASMLKECCLFLNLLIYEIFSFPHFSALSSNMLWIIEPKCWIWFCLIYFRSSLGAVSLPFFNEEYRKYAVFGTFLLNVLTYCAEKLYITLFLWTSDEVQILTSSLRVVTEHLFLISYELTILKVQFYALLFCMLWERSEIFVKYYKNIAFLNFHDGHIMQRLLYMNCKWKS